MERELLKATGACSLRDLSANEVFVFCQAGGWGPGHYALWDDWRILTFDSHIDALLGIPEDARTTERVERARRTRLSAALLETAYPDPMLRTEWKGRLWARFTKEQLERLRAISSTKRT